MGLLGQTFKPDSYSIQLEVFKIREMIRKVLQIDTIKVLTIEKVMAHMGITGNEKADQVANYYRKRAFRDIRSTHQWNHRTATMFLRERLREIVQNDYQELRLVKIVTKKNSFYSFVVKPTKRIQKTLQELTRVEAHMIVRILCNRLPLNSFQFTMRNVITPMCETCGKVDNTNHFIFTCQKYQVQRKQHAKKSQIPMGKIQQEETLHCKRLHFWLRPNTPSKGEKAGRSTNPSNLIYCRNRQIH